LTELFRVSVLNTSLTLLLPYSALWLYFSWRDKQRQLIELSEMPDPAEKTAMVPLRDEKGTLRLSLKRSDLLYLQGSDNYVTVWYLTRDRLSKYLLRNTLKKMEDDLMRDSIIRCHRSYLVNIERVKLIRRENEGLMLELDTASSVSIPVSRTYKNQVLLAFGQEE
jgi:DNA-binding LytR/AlgR family response regulator